LHEIKHCRSRICRQRDGRVRLDQWRHRIGEASAVNQGAPNITIGNYANKVTVILNGDRGIRRTFLDRDHGVTY